MIEHSNALAALHRQLAYRPDRQKLAVTVTDDHASVSIDGQPAIALPAGMHRQYLTDMLAHYPVPVRVNGQDIQASPRFDEFSIARASEGDVSDARLHPIQIVMGRYPRSVILLDSVLYTLGDCPQLDAEHPWTWLPVAKRRTGRTSSPTSPAGASIASCPVTAGKAPRMRISLSVSPTG